MTTTTDLEPICPFCCEHVGNARAKAASGISLNEQVEGRWLYQRQAKRERMRRERASAAAFCSEACRYWHVSEGRVLLEVPSRLLRRFDQLAEGVGSPGAAYGAFERWLVRELDAAGAPQVEVAPTRRRPRRPRRKLDTDSAATPTDEGPSSDSFSASEAP